MLKIFVPLAFLFLAACSGNLAHLENADGSCKFGQMGGGIHGAADHFCAASDGHALVGTR